MVKLRRLTQKNTEYPNSAARKGHEGSVRINVTIDKSGKIKNTELIRKSKYSSLNKAAMKAVKKSAPYPPIPAAVKREEFIFTAPFSFKLQ